MWRKTPKGIEPDAFRALCDRVSSLESQAKKLEGEWNDMYDKLNRLHGRLVKRDQRDKQAREDAPQSTNGTPEDISIGARRLLGRL